MKWHNCIKVLSDKIPHFPIRIYPIESRTVEKPPEAAKYVSFIVFYIGIIPMVLGQSDIRTKVIVGFLFFLSGTVFRLLYLNKATNFAENAAENNMEVAILWLYAGFSIFTGLFFCIILGILGMINFEITPK